MDCSICLEAIAEGTSSARTSCGHTFHFGCLATWAGKNTSCPLCRQAFTESDTPKPPEPGVLWDGWENVTFRNWRTRMETILPIRSDFRRGLQDDLARRYALRPIEWSIVEGLDPVDIAFIVEKAKVDCESAKAYLRFYKDPVEVIMNIVGDTFHIPDFQDRERGAAEPYVSRDISSRTGRSCLTMELYDDGYVSV